MVGSDLGVSDWTVITQAQIDGFAAATYDAQWIHVDPDRASTGPFGQTIAHGYLTLSLLPMFGAQIYQIRGLEMGVNYGANRVRFPASVPVGSRLRAHCRMLSAEPMTIGDRFVLEFTVEREGVDKPVCIAEVIYVMI